MPYYCAAGEKMLEAKGQMKHGEFGPWIRRNFNILLRHAQIYMSYNERTKSDPGIAFDSLRILKIVGQSKTL